MNYKVPLEVKLVAVWSFDELAELENASCPCLSWYGLKMYRWQFVPEIITH